MSQSSAPAKAGKSPRPCATPGCKNLVKPPKRLCPRCLRKHHNAAARARNGRSFGWGTARVLSASVLSTSDSISVNADFYHDRSEQSASQTEELMALEEVAAAQHQAQRGPNGECPFCGLIHCYCASPSEIRRATMVEMHDV